MDDPRNPGRMTEEEYQARRAKRRRRSEAGLDVPDSWEGFVDALRGLFADVGFTEEPGGLDAARLWSYLHRVVPQPCPMDAALEAGYLLGLDADAVGRALDALRRAELVAGTAEGFVTLNPAVPF